MSGVDDKGSVYHIINTAILPSIKCGKSNSIKNNLKPLSLIQLAHDNNGTTKLIIIGQ